jgi:hypothetical protein
VQNIPRVPSSQENNCGNTEAGDVGPLSSGYEELVGNLFLRKDIKLHSVKTLLVIL